MDTYATPVQMGQLVESTCKHCHMKIQATVVPSVSGDPMLSQFTHVEPRIRVCL